MKILYTAFKGNNNSSKVLLDNIRCDESDKIYLTNSFETSVKELSKKIEMNDYDLIISFGQLKLPKQTIKIELKGKGDKSYCTCYDYSLIESKFQKVGFTVNISNETNYLCNNIYYHGLKMINDRKLKCKMIFIHIPKIDKIDDIDIIARIFTDIES